MAPDLVGLCLVTLWVPGKIQVSYLPPAIDEQRLLSRG
jgi:hypothetical protein